jgi:hypothetical protein
MEADRKLELEVIDKLEVKLNVGSGPKLRGEGDSEPIIILDQLGSQSLGPLSFELFSSYSSRYSSTLLPFSPSVHYPAGPLYSWGGDTPQKCTILPDAPSVGRVLIAFGCCPVTFGYWRLLR